MAFLLTRKTATGDQEVLATLETPEIDGLILLQPDGSPLPANEAGDVLVPTIGSGGFAAVFRAKDALGLERAVKVLGAEAARLQESDTSVLAGEIRRSSAVPKKHTVPVLGFGRPVDATGLQFSYFAMPFLQGSNAAKFFNELRSATEASVHSRRDVKQRMRTILFKVLRDVAAGLEELAHERLVHMDISTANIHVTAMGIPFHDLSGLEKRASAFLLDFGAARFWTQHPEPRVLTPFVRNERFFPQRLLLDLNQICTQAPNGSWLVDSEKLGAYRDRIDLACLGRVIEILCLDQAARGSIDGGPAVLSYERLKEEYWRAVLGDDGKFLSELVDRLKTVDVAYKTAGEVREIFDSMLPTRAASPFDSLLLSPRHRGVRIRAGGALVSVAPPLKDVVDHPHFQNLKRVRQLSLLDQLYPGATHTRFVHSVHVFELGKRVAASLGRRSGFRLEFSGRRVDEVLAACLLHDLGHYPFSHSIEDLRKIGDLSTSAIDEGASVNEKRKRRERLAPLQAIRHDHELTVARLHDVDAKWAHPGRSIAQVLEDDELSCQAIQYMISKGATEAARPVYQEVGRQLVAGLIDVDRLAYLTLDSRQTGVAFGKAVDLDSLVEALRVRLDPGHVGLAIEELGLPSVEAVLAATHWMYRHVYWHRQNRAFMAAMKDVFQKLLDAQVITFGKYLEVVAGKDDYFALRWISKHFDTYVAAHNPTWKNPIAPLADGGRLAFARVLSIGRREPRHSKDATGDIELYDEITKKWTPWLADQVLEVLHETLPGREFLAKGDLLVDVPLKPRFRSRATHTERSERIPDAASRERLGHAPGTEAEQGEREKELWVKIRHQTVPDEHRWERLADASPLARRIAESEDAVVRLVRVYMPRRILERLAPRDARDLPQTVNNTLRKAMGLSTRSWDEKTYVHYAAVGEK